MFGLSLKEKSETVIKELFLYAVNPSQRPIFNSVVHNGKIAGQNEYSIAFFYMMVMMNSLIAPFDSGHKEVGLIDPRENRTDEENKEIEEFIKGHTNIILDNIHLANSPESEIKAMIIEILTNSGIEENDNDQDLQTFHNMADSLLEMMNIGMTASPNVTESDIPENKLNLIKAIFLYGMIDNLCIQSKI